MMLLDAEPAVVVPWGAIWGIVGSLLGLVGVIAAYAYKSDVSAVSIRADAAIETAKKAISLHDALKTAMAEERTERTRLEGQLLALRSEHEAREEMRERMVTREGFAERQDRQDELLATIAGMVEQVGKKTGSLQSMPAVRAQYADPRRDPSDPPPQNPPPMRPRLPSRGKYGGGE